MTSVAPKSAVPGRRAVSALALKLWETQEALEGKVETDFATARRLFTLICVLHIRG